MKICNNCKKIQKLVGYPDDVEGYDYVLKTETFVIYECRECGTYVKNYHKRYGYQTEYMPVNEFIAPDEVERLKVLNAIVGGD